MKLLGTKGDIKEFIHSVKNSGKTIGFVPTMGSLHEGHLSLFQNAKKENDIVIGSIFVNPTQFNDPNDYQLYPRNIEQDLEMLKNLADAMYIPSETEIYPQKPLFKFTFGELETIMEGGFRPGHFNGVATVVSKLFNLINPDSAYFGQKDLQQFRIIETIVKDLFFPVQLNMCPIIRESNGLAMSSRNKRLSEEGFNVASSIYKGLLLAAEVVEVTRNANEATNQAKKFFANIPQIKLEYFQIVDAETLFPANDVKGAKPIALCFAGWVDNVRLIDNIILFS